MVFGTIHLKSDSLQGLSKVYNRIEFVDTTNEGERVDVPFGKDSKLLAPIETDCELGESSPHDTCEQFRVIFTSSFELNHIVS